MLRLKGWILNTLRYQVDKKLKETVYSSEAYLENRWDFAEKFFINCSKSPKKHISILYLSFICLIALMVTLKTLLKAIIPGTLNDWNEFVEWQGIILSGQLTILGVIFPLVIGFVGFSIQNKTASRAIWTVYNRYSCFMFTGFSGLGLSVFIIIGKFLEPIIPQYWYVSASICSCVWLLFNILLTGWFLNATFKIIQARTREKLLVRYTINESFTQDIRKRLSNLIPQHAINNKLIKLADKNKVDLSTHIYSEEGIKYHTIDHTKQKYLWDISFTLLSRSMWLLTRFRKESPDGKKVQLTLPITLDNRAKMQFKVLEYKGLRSNYLFR